MRTEGEWTYYTPQEAQQHLVDKRADDEFNTTPDSDGWGTFGSDAASDRFCLYEYEVRQGILPQDKECIRRRREYQHESMHFI